MSPEPRAYVMTEWMDEFLAGLKPFHVATLSSLVPQASFRCPSCPFPGSLLTPQPPPQGLDTCCGPHTLCFLCSVGTSLSAGYLAAFP